MLVNIGPFDALLLTIIGTVISSLLIIIGIIILIIGIVKKMKYKEVSKKKKYPNILIASGAVLICIPLVVSGALVTHSFVKHITREKKMTAKDRCEIIIEAVQNKEKEPIKELFCENAKNTLDLDTELDGFFNFIDGNIISYNEPREGAEEFLSTSEDELVKSTSHGYIRKIRTDTDNEYTIFIYSFDVYEEDPGFVGMVSLGITAPGIYRDGYKKDDNYLKDLFYLIKIDYPE